MAKNKPLFALIDCNNFFVSCERVFRPDLATQPVVVLSSNDGCVVARSNEAKALDIPMGAPAFKYKHLFSQHRVVKFSANFELYGDFSRRITNILSTITPRIEIYSVDESFLDLSQLPIQDYEAWGRQVRDRLFYWVGIPVSIGVAPTKTLAKLASERAKKTPSLDNVLYLDPRLPSSLVYLQSTQLSDVWGIGRRLNPRLRAEGLHNALDVSYLPPRRAQQLMGIKGRQLVSELNGLSCLELESLHKKPKSIASTRTFGHDTDNINVLESAIARFVATASFRLRYSNQLTRRASLFITTNQHKPGFRIRKGDIKFDLPTGDTSVLLENLVNLLHNLIKPGEVYHRAGVWLHDFIDDSTIQADLFHTIDLRQHKKSQAKMEAIDNINGRFGRTTIKTAAEELSHAWQPRRNVRSPRFTTEWTELQKVKIW